ERNFTSGVVIVVIAQKVEVLVTAPLHCGGWMIMQSLCYVDVDWQTTNISVAKHYKINEDVNTKTVLPDLHPPPYFTLFQRYCPCKCSIVAEKYARDTATMYRHRTVLNTF
ncbi:hypothetical protein J6590_061891, partial [Homalodisca vitripennis]